MPARAAAPSERASLEPSESGSLTLVLGWRKRPAGRSTSPRGRSPIERCRDASLTDLFEGEE